MRKKLHNLIILAIAAISVTACTKEHDTSNSTTYITYTTNNIRATGTLDFPVTGITLSGNTTTSVTWSCPSGLVVPNALTSNPPQPDDAFNLRCSNPTSADGCTSSYAWSLFPESGGPWHVGADMIGDLKKVSDFIAIINSSENITFFCVPKAEAAYWTKA